MRLRARGDYPIIRGCPTCRASESATPFPWIQKARRPPGRVLSLLRIVGRKGFEYMSEMLT